MAAKKKTRKQKYTVLTAPRHVRLRWLKKARETRRKNYLAACRKLRKQKAASSLVVSPSASRAEYHSAAPSLGGEAPVGGGFTSYYKSHREAPVSTSGWAGWRPQQTNPELLVVSNPWNKAARLARRRMRRLGAKRPSVFVTNHKIRRNSSMRRRRRNFPVTAKIGGRKHTWKALVRKHGVKVAAKKWKKARKFHGYSKARILAKNRRRRRKNSWSGHRKAHGRAARKGWRKRRSTRKGSRRARRSRRSSRRADCRRARKGAVKYGGKFYAKSALRRKIGKRRLKALLHKRGRRANPRRRFRRKN